MDHIQFKSSQTAAAYVANELGEHQQEAFELHMMGCSECLNDVETWRVIKTHMPAPTALIAMAAAKDAAMPQPPHQTLRNGARAASMAAGAGM